MINAKELRIGNLIHDPMYGDVKVLWIMEDRSSGGCFRPVIKHTGYHSQRAISNFTGIPLTEEWLQRMGFLISNGSRGGWLHPAEAGTGFHCFIENTGEWMVLSMVEGCADGKPVKFVHKLQNLYFALTGEELKIND